MGLGILAGLVLDLLVLSECHLVNKHAVQMFKYACKIYKALIANKKKQKIL